VKTILLALSPKWLSKRHQLYWMRCKNGRITVYSDMKLCLIDSFQPSTDGYLSVITGKSI